MEPDGLILLDSMRRMRQLHQKLSGRLYTMSHGETGILQSIEQRGGYAGVSDIAKEMVVSPPAISRTLRQLRERGYVESRTDENDRRNVYLAMTPAGKIALKQEIERRQCFYQVVVERMGRDKWDQMCSLLDEFYDCMRQEIDRLPAVAQKGGA